MRVVSFRLDAISQLSSVRILLPKDLRATDRRNAVAQTIREASRRYAWLISNDILPRWEFLAEFDVSSCLS